MIDSLEEVERARAAGCGAHARSASRPGSTPTRTRRSAPATTARSSGSPPTTRSKRCGSRPRPRACTSTSARSSATSAPRAMTVDWIAAFAARARAELGWELRTLDLGGGLGVAATPEEHGALDRRVRRRPARRARPRLHAGGPRAPAGDPRAGPLAHRPRGRDALHGRLGQDGRPTRPPTSRSTAACPTTPARRSTAPATPRSSPTAPTSRATPCLHRRRQALRVGRPPDRDASSCPSRGAATSSPSRRPAPTRSR